MAPLRLEAGVPDAARLRARFDRALSSADMAMYVAKSDGRDRLREFDDEMAGAATARRGEPVFRKGGEEFVVVLPDAGDAEARLAAERIRSAVEQAGIPHRAAPTAQVMTITVGVAASQVDQPVTLQALMVRAAQAAMRAKVQAQRNQVHAG